MEGREEKKTKTQEKYPPPTVDSCPSQCPNFPLLMNRGRSEKVGLFFFFLDGYESLRFNSLLKILFFFLLFPVVDGNTRNNNNNKKSHTPDQQRIEDPRPRNEKRKKKKTEPILASFSTLFLRFPLKDSPPFSSSPQKNQKIKKNQIKKKHYKKPNDPLSFSHRFTNYPVSAMILSLRTN